jgi:hypothetical protein
MFKIVINDVRIHRSMVYIWEMFKYILKMDMQMWEHRNLPSNH